MSAELTQTNKPTATAGDEIASLKAIAMVVVRTKGLEQRQEPYTS
jgi:hypothetical protein